MGDPQAVDGRLLLIDTAGERCAVAVADLATGRILARREPTVGRGHGDVVMDVVAEALAEAGTSFGEVRRVAACVGPGSFTGIRVAIAAAKGLALSLGCETVGVSALEALAEPHLGGEAMVLAVHDARRGEVFCALYGADGEMLAEPAAFAVDVVREALGGRAGPVILVGSGAEGALAHLPEARLGSAAGEPSLDALVRIALRPLDSRALALRPLYLRGADAKTQAPAGLRAAPAS